MRYGVIVPTVQSRVRFMGRSIKVPKEILVKAIRSPSQVEAIAKSAWAIGLARALCLAPERENLPYDLLTPAEKKCVEGMARGLARRVSERFRLEHGE